MKGFIKLSCTLYLTLATLCFGEVINYPKWSRIELSFTGPESKARGEPNPFAVQLDIVFSGPNGKQYRIPGFYDGDGKGGANGNVWKVRFSADETLSRFLRFQSAASDFPLIKDSSCPLRIIYG